MGEGIPPDCALRPHQWLYTGQRICRYRQTHGRAQVRDGTRPSIAHFRGFGRRSLAPDNEPTTVGRYSRPDVRVLASPTRLIIRHQKLDHDSDRAPLRNLILTTSISDARKLTHHRTPGVLVSRDSTD
jgi:hypothetical protein